MEGDDSCIIQAIVDRAVRHQTSEDIFANPFVGDFVGDSVSDLVGVSIGDSVGISFGLSSLGDLVGLLLMKALVGLSV
jgi:hypothetical protein